MYYLKEKLTIWRMHNDSYIWNKIKSKKRFVHIEAYFDVWKNKSKISDLFLFIFIIYSFIVSFFDKLITFFINK